MKKKSFIKEFIKRNEEYYAEFLVFLDVTISFIIGGVITFLTNNHSENNCYFFINLLENIIIVLIISFLIMYCLFLVFVKIIPNVINFVNKQKAIYKYVRLFNELENRKFSDTALDVTAYIIKILNYKKADGSFSVIKLTKEDTYKLSDFYKKRFNEPIMIEDKMFKKIGYKNPFPYSEVIWCSNP